MLLIVNIVNFLLFWFCIDIDGKINDWVSWKGINDDLYFLIRY